ncbi:hypothetical protein V8G54_006870 [Vigna mungo]|uniref:Uncharacterized protein n=1 Tax=Vigna mungo TaxID=3915 RepID=A0AAQ3S7S2_VIGMU
MTFEIEERPGKTMALSTPFVEKSPSVFATNIVDSDDEPNIPQHPFLDSEGSRDIFVTSCFPGENEKISSSYDKNNEEDRNSAASASAVDKVIGSVTPRQRIMPLRKLAKKSQGRTAYTSSRAKHQQCNLKNAAADDDESQEDLSDCEDECLSDFIVDDFDELSSDNDMGDARDVSDEDIDFSKILSQIQRKKDHMEWEFEADMLADFGKDSELCMKAVCALYQQQTSEEQMSRGTLYTNQRGFSKGSTLAEYLTHGDPRGGLKKSLKELQEHDPKAVELCRTFAIRYSKQLYQIYINKENPFFP